MSWPRRLALVFAIVVPVAVVSTFLYRSRARRVAEDEAAVAVATRRLAPLVAVRKHVEAFQVHKVEYERRVQLIEELRGRPSAKTLTSVTAAAESLGLAIEEMTVSFMALTVTVRAPSARAAEQLALELEKQKLVLGAAVRSAEKDRHVLTATLLPAPRPDPTGDPRQ
jgi:hypothetical protein